MFIAISFCQLPHKQSNTVKNKIDVISQGQGQYITTVPGFIMIVQCKPVGLYVLKCNLLLAGAGICYSFPTYLLLVHTRRFVKLIRFQPALLRPKKVTLPQLQYHRVWHIRIHLVCLCLAVRNIK